MPLGTFGILRLGNHMYAQVHLFMNSLIASQRQYSAMENNQRKSKRKITDIRIIFRGN